MFDNQVNLLNNESFFQQKINLRNCRDREKTIVIVPPEIFLILLNLLWLVFLCKMPKILVIIMYNSKYEVAYITDLSGSEENKNGVYFNDVIFQYDLNYSNITGVHGQIMIADSIYWIPSSKKSFLFASSKN